MAISEITLSLIRSFKEPITSFLSDVKDEAHFLIDDGLPNYIESYREKFAETKTFLFRETKVNFHDTYFPVTLRLDKKRFQVDSLESLYQCGTCISIIGVAGSGKSMQMKYIFLKAIEQRIKIPLFIELKSLNEYDGDLMNYIYEKILNNKLSRNKKILEGLLSQGQFLFLLDGYDEIYSNNKQKVTDDLESFIDIYSSNWFIVTSRPGAGIESFPRFNNTYVLPFKDSEVVDFIDQQCALIDDFELARKIKMIIKRPENKTYEGYVKNPLLLSMFLFKSRHYPDLPKYKSTFYWQVFDTLASQHDSFTKKGGWQHERRTRLQNEDISTILQWFSYISLFDGVNNSFTKNYLQDLLKKIKKNLKFKFDIDSLTYDLCVNLNILQLDGVNYVFPHRSLQEYFAAKLISSQAPSLKTRIYQEQLKKYCTHNYNPKGILDLLNELDEIDFKKYYIIPIIEEFNKLMNNESSSSLIKSYYHVSGIKHIFNNYGGYSKHNGNYFREQVFTSTLAYLKKYSLWHMADKKIPNPLDDLTSSSLVKSEHEKNSLILDPLKNPHFIDILVKAKFHHTLEQMLEDINSIKEEYSKQIESKNKGVSTLIDLIS